MALLFVVAWRAESRPASDVRDPRQGTIYVLSLAVYCTAWTFYGGVGTAASAGWAYLPIYLGPALVYLFGQPFLRRLVQTAHADSTNSIADFVSARYGKSRAVAALVTLLAMLAAIPYIALQLKSLGMSFAELSRGRPGDASAADHSIVLSIALALAAFSIVFGARRYDATGRNRGLVLAVAAESLVKLLAYGALAVLAVFVLNAAPAPQRAQALADFAARFAPHQIGADFFVITMLSMLASFCLARQFYIGVVECRDVAHLKRAQFGFPLYLGLTALLVLPITAAGFAIAPANANPDLWVLDLPLAAGTPALALLAFLGGFSAATSMAIVLTVTLATMISNDLVAPVLLRRTIVAESADIGRLMLLVRRIAIVLITLAAYFYYLSVDRAQTLAAIGLVAFAGMAQVAPAMIGGVYWRRASIAGARAGLTAGLLLWAYTLLLPSYLGAEALKSGGFDVAFWGALNPQALFGLKGLSPLAHGALVSLGANVAFYVGVSLVAQRRGLLARGLILDVEERFGPVGDLAGLKRLAARFVGHEAAEAEFERWALDRRGRALPSHHRVDRDSVRLTERLIASVIGAPSARVIVASALTGASLAVDDVVHLLDETSQELQFSRELLAATLNSISQGVSVVDKDLRLIAWNARYLELFDFPPGFIHIGMPISEVIRHNALRGECGPGGVEAHVAKRLEHLHRRAPHVYERLRPDGRVLKTVGGPMPGGGYVSTFTDVTDEKRAQIELERAKIELEDRVAERTSELTREAALNRRLAEELHAAKGAAEAANMSKTKFLAAASHDLLQPMHAARLFSQALAEALARGEAGAAGLALRIGRAIDSADKMLRSLLDVSRLEAGGVKPVITTFALGDLLNELAEEFEPAAAENELTLRVRACDAVVRSDRILLRSILQNFIANAIRYTGQGGILVAARRRGDRIRISVWDTGPGVPDDKSALIFEEFQRLDPSAPDKGAGLGLAIAERAAKLIGARLSLRSRVGRGSQFSVDVHEVARAPRAAPPAAASLEADLSGLRVLCVDDDAEILSAIDVLLSSWGCIVHVADGKSDALAALEAHAFDVLLLDHQLRHGESGFDVWLAARARQPLLPRGALITGDSDPSVQARARAHGLRWMGKPVSPAELRAFLAGALAHSAAAAPAD